MDLLFTFCFFSVAGWILEVVYRGYEYRGFVNPGLLKGPYLILYGTGGLILFYLTHICHHLPLLLKGIIYLVVTTSLEFVSAVAAEYFFHKRLWDYSDNKWNYRGYICVKFSIYWVILSLFFEYVILPWYETHVLSLPFYFKLIFTTIISMAIIFDFSSLFKEHFFHFPPQEKKELDEEFMKLVENILRHKEVRQLKDFPHHRGKSRLEHVIEVSYYSYLIGKRLSLDTHAIVKGAMLHDLFFYDWLREGPRLHGLRHPAISLKNARELEILSKKEEDIIKKHMWPLTPIPPRYMESLVVAVVDTFCSLKDYIPLPQNRADILTGVVPLIKERKAGESKEG